MGSLFSVVFCKDSEILRDTFIRGKYRSEYSKIQRCINITNFLEKKNTEIEQHIDFFKNIIDEERKRYMSAVYCHRGSNFKVSHVQENRAS